MLVFEAATSVNKRHEQPNRDFFSWCADKGDGTEIAPKKTCKSSSGLQVTPEAAQLKELCRSGAAPKLTPADAR